MDIEPGPARDDTSQAPSRRAVLRGGTALSAVAAGGILAGPGRLAEAARPAIRGISAAQAAEPPAGARSYDFDLDWKFFLVNPDGITDPTGQYGTAYQPGFDDSGWQALDLPHDWSIERDPVGNGRTISGNGFFQGGLGWYRKTFTLPPSMAGKRIWIEFDGVYSNPSVYLNGTLLGSHPYAYTGFG